MLIFFNLYQNWYVLFALYTDPFFLTGRNSVLEFTLSLNILSPAENYMFKVNNKNFRTRCEIYSELAIKITASFWFLY